VAVTHNMIPQHRASFVSLRMAAAKYKKPASTRTSCNTYSAQGHTDSNTLYFTS